MSTLTQNTELTSIHHPLTHPSSFAYPLMKNSFQMFVHLCNINVCCSVSTKIKNTGICITFLPQLNYSACRTVYAATPVKVKAVIQHWSKVECIHIRLVSTRSYSRSKCISDLNTKALWFIIAWLVGQIHFFMGKKKNLFKFHINVFSRFDVAI